MASAQTQTDPTAKAPPKKPRTKAEPLPPVAAPATGWAIEVAVDWANLPMNDAQMAYAELKTIFEKAGFILNQRSMPTPGAYVCFMCEKRHLGDSRGKDYSFVNPVSGLMAVVECCGEFCWKYYQDFRIAVRALKNQCDMGQLSAQDYKDGVGTALEEIRKKARSKV